MTDCIFCKIIQNEIKGDLVFRDDQVTAFRDIHPAAPTHILIVPNQHIESINMLTEEDAPLIGQLFVTARQLAAQEGISASGYRLIINTHADAGQTVFHIHLHLLGGAPMKHAMG